MQWFLLVVYWQNCHPSPQLILGGITPERKPVPVSTLDLLLTYTTLRPHFTSPTLRHLLTYFLSPELPALDISINGVMHLVIFGDWFLSLNLVFSRFSPTADISASFLLLLTKLPLCEYTTFHLYIHQLTGIWVVCVIGLFTRCVASWNLCVQVFA